MLWLYFLFGSTFCQLSILIYLRIVTSTTPEAVFAKLVVNSILSPSTRPAVYVQISTCLCQWPDLLHFVHSTTHPAVHIQMSICMYY